MVKNEEYIIRKGNLQILKIFVCIYIYIYMKITLHESLKKV